MGGRSSNAPVVSTSNASLAGDVSTKDNNLASVAKRSMRRWSNLDQKIPKIESHESSRGIWNKMRFFESGAINCSWGWRYKLWLQTRSWGMYFLMVKRREMGWRVTRKITMKEFRIQSRLQLTLCHLMTREKSYNPNTMRSCSTKEVLKRNWAQSLETNWFFSKTGVKRYLTCESVGSTSRFVKQPFKKSILSWRISRNGNLLVRWHRVFDMQRWDCEVECPMMF